MTKPDMATGIVTVAIPVLNGARYLDEVLTAVRGQKVDREIELLIVDSGSTDGSLDIARKHGARIIEIDKKDFSHGGTRNMAVAEARGEYVVFLTQDATPASERWLAAMLEGFSLAPDVALVFGPHIARPDAGHMIHREMRDHFKTWGNGSEIDVQRLEQSPEGLASYRAFPGAVQFFSDVNGGVARWAWEHVHYKEVPYAEDQLIGREMIEAGYAKVFHPDAAVIHSHDYPPVTFLRRYFDEFRSLREVLGHVEQFDPGHVARSVAQLTRADRKYLQDEGITGTALHKKTAVSARHHLIRMVGAGLGTRSDKLPSGLRKRLSLEGRGSFKEYALPASPLLNTPGTGSSKPKSRFEFVRQCYPRAPLVLEEQPGPLGDKESLTLAWILPPWAPGSGGHTTIFRLIKMMEERGHLCSIFVYDQSGNFTKSGDELAQELRDHFIPLDAQVFNGLDRWIGADVAIATFWTTAYPLRDLPGCYEKVYLVQDFEPAFYPYSAEYLWAEETYNMGYRCIAYTPWMSRILEEEYGLDSEWFECGTDTDTYTFGTESREPATIAVYARSSTARRAVELSLEALAIVKESRPDVNVVLFGSDGDFGNTFEYTNLGVVSPRELAALYRRSTVGMVFSLTTHSLVAQEMMASGLPVVELAGDNVASALGESGEVAIQASPDPVSVAEAIERLLDDLDLRTQMAGRARKFVEAHTWDEAGDRVDAAFRRFLNNPVDAAERLSKKAVRVADSLGLQPSRVERPS